MAATSELTKLRQRLAAEDSYFFLGRIFWFTVSEVRIPHRKFAKLLKTVGIDKRPPPEPKDVDIFTRICSAMKRDKLPTADPNVFETYRTVGFKDEETVTRRVIRERVNNKGRRLEITELFDITFDRSTADLIFKGRGGHRITKGSVSEQIRDEITDLYYLWRGCLNAYAIREWMRHLIIDANATIMRPGGGVYFLPQAQIPVIESLEALEEDLAKHLVSESGQVEIHSLPLLDDRKQRERVQKAFEAETVGAIDEMLVEIAEINRGKKKITQAAYTKLVVKAKELGDRTDEYADLLEAKLGSTDNRVELFREAVFALADQVKE